MNKLLFAAALLAMGSAHAASLPKFEVTCPTDLAVRADAGGPVFINDKKAMVIGIGSWTRSVPSVSGWHLGWPGQRH